MRRRHVLAAAASLVLVPLLAACGGSTYDITNHQLPSGNGAFVKSASILAQNVVLVADPNNNGRYSLTGTWVNLSGTADEILSVSGHSATDLRATEGIPVGLAGNDATLIGPLPGSPTALNAAVTPPPQIVLAYPTSLTSPVLPGRYVDLQIIYRRNGVAMLHLLVVPPIGQYADFAPGAAVSTGPGQTPTPSASPSKK